MFHKVFRTAIWTAGIVLFLARLSLGQVSIHVNEAAARIWIHPHDKIFTSTVELPVDNPSSETLRAHVNLELIDPSGKIQRRAEGEYSLRPGSSAVKVPLPALSRGSAQKEQENLLWSRLRYSIVPVPATPPSFAAMEGIIAAGAIAPQLFDLHVAGDGIVRPGGRTTLRVRAIHPVTGRPVPKVTVQASLDIDDDNGEPVRTRTAVTGRDGFAMLDFAVPKDLDADEYTLGVTLTGTLGGLSVEADDSLPILHDSRGCLSTDKPLYQPGQTVHMRLLAFGEDKKALADLPVTIEIKDPEYTVVHAAHIRTSRFGIAAANWQIPENLRLGDYKIHAGFDDDRYEGAQGWATVKISRYELPTFSVQAKPDRAYYLPGQNAQVEVRADYLFGKPVSHGHVRVVREGQREWNYREQKWDIEEGEVYEGDTDANGRFLAQVDLTDDHDELADNDYQRFRDLRLAAYFTDVSTRRTEQRRFDVRISKEPIHVYIIEDSYRLVSSGLPVEFFISTDSADGTPASCDVQISWLAKPNKKSPGGAWEVPLRRVHTNRYGLARVTGLRVPVEPDSADTYLNFRATDRKGDVGHHSEDLEYSDDPVIRVSTDKTLYRPDDPIEVSIASNQRNVRTFVDVLTDYRVLESHAVPLTGGRGNLVIPPSDKFRDAVTIFAYAFGQEPSKVRRSESAFSGSHTVLFPKKHDLQLTVRPEKSTYRPGDEATVNFRVSGPEGESLESALGLVVVDKALEERQRTDEEFGQARGFYGFRNLWGEDESFKGIRRKDLENLDLSLPLPKGMDLAAEVLLRGGSMYHTFFESDSGHESLRQIYAKEIDPQLNPVAEDLIRRYDQTREYPKSIEALRDELASAGRPPFDKLRDPWGEPYKATFKVERQLDMLIITSVGPDKKFGTDDDFDAARMGWPYFKPHADAIQKALDGFHAQTGGYVRDLPALKGELKREGSDLDAWKDPWGHLYQYTFGVFATNYTVTVTSAGPDGRFTTTAEPSEDDFALTTAQIDYSLEIQNRISSALNLKRYGEKEVEFPQKEEELQKILHIAGIEWDSLRDPWGRRYYATFRQDSMYADRLTVETYAEHGQPKRQQTQIVPVTRTMNWIYIRSAGPDQIEGTQDDFTVATFSRAMLEQSAKEKAPAAVREQSVLTGATGAISGTVIDQTGAVIPGADVSAKNLATNLPFSATAGNDGKYTLRNLPSGLYYVAISKLGFRTYAVTDVPVQSSNITLLDVTLQVGQVTQEVTVEAAAPQLQTASASLSVVASKTGLPSIGLRPALATPRLRDYFPETLLWRPELVTDGKGRAQVKFPLAGNITTWKLAVVASTVDGEIGTTEKEIRAFQPFFIEHDPPRFLTAGDEIDLPVVVRNYLDHPVQANLEMSPQSWFSLASPPQEVEIPANDSANRVFHFTATSPVKQGKQRVMARSSDVADAVEKTVTVHPDGREEVQTLSQLLEDKAAVDLNIPDRMIPGSLQATLKIYPNLNAHVLESIEAIMERPYGCAEQAISTAYPGVLYLRYAGKNNPATQQTSARALRYLQLGYTRLLSYQASDGSFTYWGRGKGDLALTAYALRFLLDARTYIQVDESVIDSALSWLLQQAQSDGRWVARRWDDTEDVRASAQLTAYIARIIASAKLPDAGEDVKAKVLHAETSKALERALDYVEPQAASLDEPYLIAAFTLAALDTGQDARAAASLNRLRTLVHREGNASYWALETNTPFYGWGMAGRVETTALALQALEKSAARQIRAPEDDDLIARGWLFLLKHQDRYGIWYSTQATVNVLDAIAAVAGPQKNNATPSKAEILIDGRPTVVIDLPIDSGISPPVLADLSGYLTSGTHRVEVRRPAGSNRASLQLVADYYVPWTTESVSGYLNHEEGASEALRLGVHFDRDSVKPGEIVHCTVEAERIGFRGYGMMLAEIGLPPGAEVDRATLESALTASDWSINQYDILPDRVVLYLWPRAGGVKFSFAFKFRYGLNALSTRSVLYDYYNPEAQAEVKPTRFLVK